MKVEYKQTYVRFVSTADQEAKVKDILQATGFAIDIKPFEPEDLQVSDSVA